MIDFIVTPRTITPISSHEQCLLPLYFKPCQMPLFRSLWLSGHRFLTFLLWKPGFVYDKQGIASDIETLWTSLGFIAPLSARSAIAHQSHHSLQAAAGLDSWGIII
jgi:hypothetical protein